MHSKWLSRGKPYLPHVGNIEERGLAVTTAPQVLLHDASVLAALVQDRQLVAREGNHITAELLVEVVESGLSEGLVGSGGQRALGHRTRGGAESSGGGSIGSSRCSSEQQRGGRTHCAGEIDWGMQLLTIVLIELLRSTSTLSSASPYPDGFNGTMTMMMRPPHAVPDLKYAVPAFELNLPGMGYRLLYYVTLLRRS